MKQKWCMFYTCTLTLDCIRRVKTNDCTAMAFFPQTQVYSSWLSCPNWASYSIWMHQGNLCFSMWSSLCVCRWSTPQQKNMRINTNKALTKQLHRDNKIWPSWKDAVILEFLAMLPETVPAVQETTSNVVRYEHSEGYGLFLLLPHGPLSLKPSR